MWPDNVNVTEDYFFKSSPESDNMENVSDEDFMTQLSLDLDIPLLLNPGEDEMGVLNSFFDKTPDEILSDITSSPDYMMNDNMDIKDFDFLNEVLHVAQRNVETTNKLGKHNIICAASDDLSKSCNKTLRNIKSSNDKGITYFEYLNGAIDPPTDLDHLDIKSEEHSDESCSSRNSLEPSTPPPTFSHKKVNPSIFFDSNTLPKKEIASPIDSKNVQVVPQTNKPVKIPIKRVPIKPKAPYTVPVKNTNNIVVIKNIKTEFSNINNKESTILGHYNNMSSNIVVLDSIPVSSFNTVTSFNHLNTSTSANLNGNIGVDPRMLKRQERRIKNRESASISRKKKKDYVNSLEEQIKDLAAENKQLIRENASLRERLSFFEDHTKFAFNKISPKGAKPAVVLCVFLLVVGLNLTSSPFLTKSNKIEAESSSFQKLPDHHGRNLLWTSKDTQDETLKNHTYFSSLTMCPASINQSESARLLLELEKWIGKPEPIKKLATHVKLLNQKPKTRRKKMRLDLSLAQIKKRERYGPENEIKNEIEVFSPSVDQVYSEFFDAINRQDDTFYVVSFSEQHMLLPALHHNKTRRPKMSLLMPSVFSNETSTQSYIPLMQIDCEVLDTKLINVKYGSIPRPYRHYGNVTKGSDTSKRTDNATSSRKYGSKKAYKPYFLTKNVLKAVTFD